MPRSRAAICRLGHLVSRDADEEPPGRRCPRCGVEVLSRCVSCGAAAEGPEFTLRQGPPPTLVRVYASDYEAPERCERCHKPHPWAQLGSQKRPTE